MTPLTSLVNPFKMENDKLLLPITLLVATTPFTVVVKILPLSVVVSELIILVTREEIPLTIV